jgi:hypothetical protein
MARGGSSPHRAPLPYNKLAPQADESDVSETESVTTGQTEKRHSKDSPVDVMRDDKAWSQIKDQAFLKTPPKAPRRTIKDSSDMRDAMGNKPKLPPKAPRGMLPGLGDARDARQNLPGTPKEIPKGARYVHLRNSLSYYPSKLALHAVPKTYESHGRSENGGPNISASGPHVQSRTGPTAERGNEEMGSAKSRSTSNVQQQYVRVAREHAKVEETSSLELPQRSFRDAPPLSSFSDAQRNSWKPKDGRPRRRIDDTRFKNDRHRGRFRASDVYRPKRSLEDDYRGRSSSPRQDRARSITRRSDSYIPSYGRYRSRDRRDRSTSSRRR